MKFYAFGGCALAGEGGAFRRVYGDNTRIIDLSMQIYRQIIQSMPEFKELKANIKSKSPVTVTGLSEVARAMFYYALGGGLIVTADENAAKRICGDINAMEPEAAVLFPAKDIMPADSMSRDYEFMRLAALSKFHSGGCGFLVAPVHAVMQYTVSPKTLKSKTLKFKVGDEVTEFPKLLSGLGYTRSATVEGRSQFAVRGSIVDIYPVGAVSDVRTGAVRIELWGDYIDSISALDTVTQRRLDKQLELSVIPAAETDESTLFEHISPVFADDFERLRKIAKGISLQHNEDVEFLLESRHRENRKDSWKNNLKNNWMLLDFDTVAEKISVRAQAMPRDMSEGISEPPCSYTVSASGISSDAAPVKFNGNVRALTGDLKRYKKDGFCVIVSAGNAKTLPILADDLEAEGVTAQKLAGTSKIHAGTVYLTDGQFSDSAAVGNVIVIAGERLNPVQKKKKNPYKSYKGAKIGSLEDLTEGDLIVHERYGIGRFIGI
ncbi:MAG: hypothetical protein LBR54_00450, partial [Oscillospiraceae bacterium]|nr:hypothetical protein [Oscillospiraceae bacterium]